MPFPVNAIKGKANIQRKREKLVREASGGFSDLPDWMFWEADKREAYIDNVKTIAEAKAILKGFGAFANLVIRFLGKYEERE